MTFKGTNYCQLPYYTTRTIKRKLYFHGQTNEKQNKMNISFRFSFRFSFSFIERHLNL